MRVKQKGDFKKLTGYLERAKSITHASILDKYGKLGVEALSHATPVDTGKTAASWYYTVERKRGKLTIAFHNDNVVNGVQIALILQYGHGTARGGYVQGVDYINPAIRPIFESLANEAWGEVTRV